MRIGFDARAAFRDPHRGFGRVAAALLEALLDLPAAEVVVFVPHGVQVPQRWYTRAAALVELRRPRRGAFLADAPAWQWTARRCALDVLYLPAWGVPPRVPCPVVATFHDATPLRFKSPPSRWPRWRARRGILSLRRATLVHAVSRYAADEAGRVLGVARQRIHVQHWGVGAPFTEPRTPRPPRHLLYVGGADPHKNLDLLFDVYALPEAVHLPPLLVAGPAAADAMVARQHARLGLDTRVEFEPGLDDERLADRYAEGYALLVPSLNEGFGLPVLEAMACGCPALVADAGALPEVSAGAARVLPARDPAAWLEAALRLVRNPQEREDWRQRGFLRSAEATWARAAEGVLGVLQEAARR